MGRLNLKQDDHDQTTITHFSHIHPLHLTNLNNQFQTLNPYNSPCSACKLTISGSVYSCHLCKFFLHLKCTQMPQHIKHPFDSNKNHVFSLLPVPIYPEGYFKCDACGKHGNGFSYHCGICKIDLHLLCALMPLSSSHHSHNHDLRLFFFSPYQNNGFSCDVCKNPGSNSWLYRCDHCQFDVHLDCAIRQIPIRTPNPPPRQSPDLYCKITYRIIKGGGEAFGQQSVSNMFDAGGGSGGEMLQGGGGGGSGGEMLQGGGGGSGGEMLQGGGGSGGEMLQGGGGGGLDLSSVFGGCGGGSGGEMLQGGGGGSLDLSSVFSGCGGGLDLSSVMGGGGGSLDLSSVFSGCGGGLDLSSVMGGGGGLDLSSVLGGGVGGLSSVLGGGGDLSSVLGGMDASSLMGGMDISGLGGI